MIVEFFMQILATIQGWFIDLLGTDSPPPWVKGAAAALGDVIERASGLGAWFPFALLATVTAFLLSLWLVLWSIKGGRWVWGLTPFSGGS